MRSSTISRILFPLCALTTLASSNVVFPDLGRKLGLEHKFEHGHEGSNLLQRQAVPPVNPVDPAAPAETSTTDAAVPTVPGAPALTTTTSAAVPGVPALTTTTSPTAKVPVPGAVTSTTLATTTTSAVVPPVAPVDPNVKVNPNPAPLPSEPAVVPGGPVGGKSITVQWMETVIDKTVTWVPVTVTFEFAAVPSQAPSPGVGKIGMGDLSKGMEIKETGTAARGGENAAPTMGVGMGVSGVLWVMVGMGIGMF